MSRYGFLLVGTLVVLTGCGQWGKQTTRAQISTEDTDKKNEYQTIGDVSVFDTITGIPVSGVGLVTGLDGNGGSTPPSDYRTLFEEFLKKKKGVTNTKELIDNPNNALVLVSAIVPAGSRRGDLIDLQITLPPQSKVKSLRGGYLLSCELFNYDTRNNVRQFLGQDNKENDAFLKGSTLVVAEGPVHLPMNAKGRSERSNKEDDSISSTDQKTGYVWSGGRCLSDRPYYLVLNPDHQRYRMAMQVAQRINETFSNVGTGDVAKAARKELVAFYVPPQYKLNLPHFLRVVRNITMDRIGEGSPYKRKLEEMLQEPATAVAAAVKLEAIGKPSVKILKAALDASYPLVRFSAAEALAYLGEPAGAAELSRLAQEHPALQAYCLTALGSMDEAASVAELQELCSHKTPEVRYGAFRAIRSLDPTMSGSLGEKLRTRRPNPESGEESRLPISYYMFYLHEIPSKGPPLVHALSGKRAEIVLFGERPSLLPDCSLITGEFTVTTKKDDSQATVSRFSPKYGRIIEQCSINVGDVIRTLAGMGATYNEVVELIRQAYEIKGLNCAFAVDALPKALTIKQLAEMGRNDPKMLEEIDLLNSNEELGTTPNLYDRATPITNTDSIARGQN